MAVRGLEGIEESVQQTHIWINEVAAGFHGTRHQALRVIRAYLHLLRDHLPLDESAQLAAQLPLIVRGIYYEGWDPSHSLQKERSAEAFISRFVAESGVREMDARDAITAVSAVLRRHVSGGEVAQVYQSLPSHIRALVV